MPNDFSQNPKKSGAKPVSELLGKVMEPVMARRAGMTLDLIRAWPEISGPEFARVTKPEKINWPRRVNEEDPFEPATLVVACESSAALFFQHEHGSVLDRVNLFFGFEAIKRIRIVQKPVVDAKEPAIHQEIEQKLSNADEVKLQSMLDDVEDAELKETLARLGRGILSSGES